MKGDAVIRLVRENTPLKQNRTVHIIMKGTN